jgi:hypothetical protein
VDLGRSGDLEPPEVHVVLSADVAKTLREDHARWLRGTNPCDHVDGCVSGGRSENISSPSHM